MKDLKASDKNIISIYDKPSGTKLIYFYRTPKTEDRIDYNRSIVNVLAKMKDPGEVLRIQIQWGLKLLTGFADGIFTIEGKPISSDPESKNYYSGWKGLLEETASADLLLILNTILGEPNLIIKNEAADIDFFAEKSGTTSEGGHRRKSKDT